MTATIDPLTLRIINYPHPTLRHKSRPLKRVDEELRRLIRRMFELMYDTEGVGLAANQVDLPYRLFVANITADPKQPDQEHVFVNPVITSPKGVAESSEGCLSIPGVTGNVKRPEKVRITGYNLAGQVIDLALSGLFARVVQHEVDHLDGVLFIDRLSPTERLAVKDDLATFETEFHQRRLAGEIDSDDVIRQRLQALEAMRT